MSKMIRRPVLSRVSRVSGAAGVGVMLSSSPSKSTGAAPPGYVTSSGVSSRPATQLMLDSDLYSDILPPNLSSPIVSNLNNYDPNNSCYPPTHRPDDDEAIADYDDDDDDDLDPIHHQRPQQPPPQQLHPQLRFQQQRMQERGVAPTASYYYYNADATVEPTTDASCHSNVNPTSARVVVASSSSGGGGGGGAAAALVAAATNAPALRTFNRSVVAARSRGRKVSNTIILS